MDIILEGPDNAGKSTLAKSLGDAMNRIIVSSEGREKFPGEINERVKRYAKDYKDVIFDRHPVISQSIYFICGNKTFVDDNLVKDFYSKPYVYVYCRPVNGKGLDGHVVKEYDDPAFLKQIEEKYDALVNAYDKWALERANIIYRIGDSMDKTIRTIIEASKEILK